MDGQDIRDVRYGVFGRLVGAVREPPLRVLRGCTGWLWWFEGRVAFT